jgi:hypothetical protein
MSCKNIAGGNETTGQMYTLKCGKVQLRGHENNVRISFTWKIRGQIGKILAVVHKKIVFLLIFKSLKTKVL